MMENTKGGRTWAKLATLPTIFTNKVLLDHSQATVYIEWLVFFPLKPNILTI